MTRPIPKESITRLLVRGPNWIGDAVMSEPALSGIRHMFPQAEITLLVKPSIAEIFQGHPSVDQILRYETAGQHAGLSGKWALSRTIRRRRFDMAILFQNAFEAGLLTWLSGIPYRYGYATDGRGFLLTHAIPIPRQVPKVHQVHYYLELLAPLGVKVDRPSPRLVISTEEEQALRAQLVVQGVQEGDFLIGVNPGSTYGSAKRWFPERFAEVADRSVQEASRALHLPVKVVIVGAPGEELLGEQIGARMQASPLHLSGKTTIRELMALMKRCGLLITNDTGPMHLAAAFGVPVVAVFGPTDAQTTSPMGSPAHIVRHPVDCSPCLLRECPIDHRCMDRVGVEDVMQASSDQLVAIAEHKRSESSGRTDGPGLAGFLTGVTVFLDRDGTINKDVGYLGDRKDLALLSGAVEAVARLKQAGALVILITNQSGIGRGLFSQEALQDIHRSLCHMLQDAGGGLDAIYFCPHHPDDGCACRKPERGMIDQAIQEHPINLSLSYFVGDHRKDIDLARRIGARSVLVRTGPTSLDAEQQLLAERLPPDFFAANLGAAVDWIVQDRQQHLTRSGSAQPVQKSNPQS